jgi:FeS assembly SUF system protein
MEEKEYPPDSTESKVVEVLKTCYDPEIPVDIYQLGLIYNVAVDEEKVVQITMTLTSPACPVAGTLPPEIQQKVKDQVEDVTDANVEVVWDPPWSTDMMSEAAKLQLGMM